MGRTLKEPATFFSACRAGILQLRNYSMKKLTATAIFTSLMMTASGAAIADGAATYQKACVACHMTGAAGAPKLEDKAAWTPRLAQGTDVLYNSVLKGKGAMPPKGGQAQLSDDEIKAAVDYMIAQTK
jgi:cytochrome c5